MMKLIGKFFKKITSVEAMTLTLRDMHGGVVYRINGESGKAVIQRYREIYSNEETSLQLEESAVCEIGAFIELTNNCNVLRWNGFHGKHPKNVLDGVMFQFTATVNGEKNIQADGSAKFPKGYHDFMREINKLLAESENKK